MSRLTKLPNIGTVLAERLEKIGIESQAELSKMGSIEAVLKVDEKDIDTCYNMLYALEGAIRGVRWHSLAKEERALLKEAFDEAWEKQQS